MQLERFIHLCPIDCVLLITEPTTHLGMLSTWMFP